MPLFNYTAIDKDGNSREGSIDAVNEDVAINSLQRRGLVIVSIEAAEEGGILSTRIAFFERVATKDIVILSRQISTLFESQVSVLKVFSMLGSEVENALLKDTLAEIAHDIQGGSTIAKAMEKHPKVFSPFYVNMVKAGEESGQLEKVFAFLADYLDRNYAVTSKAKNALVYPAFVMVTFVGVMILMLTTVIPNISQILIESGQEIPFYTKLVLGLSSFFVNYGILLAVLLVVGIIFLVNFVRTEEGAKALSRVKLATPLVGNLYRKLYLSRIADNMTTMLSSGIAMVRAIEISADIVDDKTYEHILKESAEVVKGGEAVSAAFEEHEEIPSIMTQMVRVGEESGELSKILNTLSTFYRREVVNAVDTMVGLIEPIMIVMLAAGVGVLLASVLIPIYNLSSAI